MISAKAKDKYFHAQGWTPDSALKTFTKSVFPCRRDLAGNIAHDDRGCLPICPTTQALNACGIVARRADITARLDLARAPSYTRPMQRLPLKSIEAFVAVARAGNLARAAIVMNLTVPALSRRIQQLEAGLGVRLFERLPRGLALTDLGRDYYAALDPAWEAMLRATDALAARTRRNRVMVSVMPTFAANWLIPRLQRFQARHRTIEVDVRTSAEIEDLDARSELDCAIRLGHGPWPGLVSEPLLPVHAVPVASPLLAAKGYAPQHPCDLLDRRLIGTHHQIEFWQEWFAANGIDVAPKDCVAFDNLQVVYEAASAGMGIALGLAPVVRPFLAMGRLVPLFADQVRLPRQFHLVRRDAVKPARGFAMFRDWLFAEADAFAAECLAGR